MKTEAKEGRAGEMDCPNNHGKMERKKGLEEINFRGMNLRVEVEHYVCPQCGIAVDDLSMAANTQSALSNSYRKAAGLLTGNEIAEERKKRNWTQEDLARTINVGIASIKRWEKGQIQTKAMDDALRRAFSRQMQTCDPYVGNRHFSLERIKLVLEAFTKPLGRRLLKASRDDKLLYAAKYLWFADMLAFRKSGRGMTGASYARLPKGPQLNNYNDLVPLIKEADASSAEPLTQEECRIINKIAMTFPTDKLIYDASHLESAWKDRKVGELIPYSDAERIKEI
jgi:putative zinc finger/helix-turn-helix YgiT family protein